MRAVLSVGLLAGLTTAAECQRTPPEDFGTHQAPTPNAAQAITAPAEASPSAAAAPARPEAALSKERYRELGLMLGDTVYVTPKKVAVFLKDQAQQDYVI